MNLHKCLLTRNDCYKAGRTIRPMGVMVHSTAGNNPWLKRYVGPDDGLLGVNKNNNHWNMPGVGACVHAFIGKLADGSVATYQTLPWTMRGWHCGKGSKGSGNDTHISFEICEDGLTDASYFQAVYREAVELTAHLCKEFGLDPLKDGVVICHAEGHKRGIASNHGDVLHWFPKHGKTMDDFRADVAKEMKGESDLTEKEVRAIVRDEYAKIEAERAKLPASEWAVPHIQEAIDRGLMTENAAGSIDRPRAAVTRQELATVANAIYKALE